MLPEVSVNIRKLRRLVCLTQVELAKRTGISRVRLSMAECGYLHLNPDEVSRITEVAKNELEVRLRRIGCSTEGARKEASET